MRKIKFEDFNDLEVTRAFDNNGRIPFVESYLQTNKQKILRMHLESGDRGNILLNLYNEWKSLVESSNELNNILYISEMDMKKFVGPDIIKSRIEDITDYYKRNGEEMPLFDRKLKEATVGSVGIIYCESGLSMLYVFGRENLSFMLFDEFANDTKARVIRKDKLLRFPNLPVITTTSWIKYGMYGPILSFGSIPLVKNGNLIFRIPFEMKLLVTGNSSQEVSIDKNLYKIVLKEDKFLAQNSVQSLVEVQSIDPNKCTEIRQVEFDNLRRNCCFNIAVKILSDIVFNPDTETVVFTESMADQYSKRHGLEKDESLIGITRIKDQTWMKEIIVDHPFGVCGHYRRLHNPNTVGKDYDGTPIQGRTWIKEFTKKGYHRKPQRDIEFEREDN